MDILHTKPINKTAVNVVFKGGFSEEFKPCKDNWHKDSPFKTRKCPRSVQDLTGKRIGRMTVIGLLAIEEKPPNSKDVVKLLPNGPQVVRKKTGRTKGWVCRCSCGKYEIRHRKSILNPKAEHACEECLKTLWARKKFDFRTTGRDKPLNEYL